MLSRRNLFVSGCAGMAQANSQHWTPQMRPASTGSLKRQPVDAGLPEFTTGCRLLFQGDSITDMKWGRNQKDRNHYLGHSYVFLIAARLGVELANAQLEIYNRGISGNTVADLGRRWRKDAIDIKPDLLSILIGTNDVGKSIQPEVFKSSYREILKASRKANPRLRLVLLDPFVLQSGRLQNYKTWEMRRAATDQIGEMVLQLTQEFDAVHVKTQLLFDAAAKKVSPEHWIWDGVHPLPQGHELIAREWIRQVSLKWPQNRSD
ncbi:MAG: SGNH/GDSL hydrolase family protein [Planctomycetota bacterium]|nr:SGNH/GDSL hydrolase family protein [Planctomycetota bacterium]